MTAMRRTVCPALAERGITETDLLISLRMAGGTGTAGEGQLLFRTGLDHIEVTAEAGISHMAATEDLTVVDDLEVRIFGVHIFGIMAASGTALELGSSAGDLMMAHGALLLIIDSERREVCGHLGVADRAVVAGMDIVVEIHGLLRQLHLDGAGGDMCELRGGGRQGQSGDKQGGGANRQQLFHRDDPPGLNRNRNSRRRGISLLRLLQKEK